MESRTDQYRNGEDIEPMLCNMLREPRADARCECACNLMKMGAAALAAPNLFLRSAWDETLDLITRQIVACLTEQKID